MEFFKCLLKKEPKKEEIKEQPITIHHFINQKKDNFNECVICLEEMKLGEKLAILSCSHMYHSECINAWGEKKRLCPLCDYSF